jgi:ElaB/YqjD/DUF883 family membrane-anchored ribosome-binding protein
LVSVAVQRDICRFGMNRCRAKRLEGFSERIGQIPLARLMRKFWNTPCVPTIRLSPEQEVIMANKSKEANLDDRIERGAERLKERESAVLHATRDALNSGSDRAEEALHKATDAGAGAAKRTSERAAKLGGKGQEKWTKGREYAEKSMDSMLDYVRENPGKSLALAVAGGWLIGNFLRRR